MWDVSQTYKDILATDGHWFEHSIVIGGLRYGDGGGTGLTRSLLDVRIERSVFRGETPSVGDCLAAELYVTMIAPSDTIPRMAEIRPYVRVTDGTQTSEWVPQGVFYIDTREVTKNNDGRDVLTIHAYDAMLQTDADYPDSSHDWPYSDINVVSEIAYALGVDVDDRTWDIMTEGYPISLPAGYSMREVLENIASMYASNWIMNYDGDLLLVSVNGIPEETNYLIDHSSNVITFGTEATENEYSGNVASFYISDTIDFDELTVTMSPNQSLNGYDSPWPPGGGVKKFDISTVEYGKWVDASGGVGTASAGCVSAAITISNGSTVTIKTFGTTPFSMAILEYNSSNGFVKRTYNNNRANLSATLDSNTAYIKVEFASGSGSSSTITEAILESYQVVVYASPDNPTAWTPYENICPITGHDSATVWDAGKNLLDASNCVDNIYPDGGAMKFRSISGASVFYASVKPNTTYTLSANNGDRTIICSCDTTPASGVAIKRIIYSSSTLLIPQTFTTAAGETLVALYVNRYASTKPTEIQLELGSTATAYEAYSGTTVTASFSPTPGIVYAGTYNFITGALTANMVKVSLGNYTWNVSGGYHYTSQINNFKRYPFASNVELGRGISNVYKNSGSSNISNSGEFSIFFNLTYQGYRVFINDAAANDKTGAQFKQYLTDIGAELCYELATPLTYQLTPASGLKTLFGYNNIFSDAGTVDVVFTTGGEVVRILV